MSAAVALPDGRTVSAAPDVADHLVAGTLVVDGVTVTPEPAVWAETATLSARLRAEHAGRKPSEIPGLQEARDLYKRFGMEPTRHRPSSEALLRRILAGKEIYRLDNAVDVCNLASLEFLLPIGMYDLDRVEGDVTLRLGRGGEEYEGIRKGPVHLADRLGLFDDAGGFGSPTSDSRRTCVSGSTRRLLAVVMATGTYPHERMTAHVERFGALLVTHCGGDVAHRGLIAPDV